MEAILERGNMLAALKRVEGNKGAPGVDGMKTAKLRGYVSKHWDKIKSALLEGRHRPEPVRRVEIPKESGGVRPLGIPTALDEGKISAGRPWHGKHLGFRITRMMGKTRTGIHPDSVERFRRKVRELTARERGLALTAVAAELNSPLRGWAEYFRPGLRETLAKELDHWIRRRLRAYVWKQWSRPQGDGPQRSLRQRSEAKWQPAEDAGREPHRTRHLPRMGAGGRQLPQGRVAAEQERNGVRGAARRLVHSLGGRHPAGLILSVSGRLVVRSFSEG